VEAVLIIIDIEYYPEVNNRSKCDDGLFNSMINDKGGHIPLPLIILT